ncbi:MAG: hypothetical protein AAB262_02430 [Elusimicrobiota bacterium]
MFTSIGIALMVVMMGGMFWGGHKMMGGGHQKHTEKHAQTQAPASHGHVAVSSSPVEGVR